MQLSTKQRRYLKGQAHHLKPAVWMGNKGMTPEVHEKVIFELKNHELIKVKVPEGELSTKEASVLLADGSESSIVQVIGRIVVLYKRRKKDPEIKLPKA